MGNFVPHLWDPRGLETVSVSRQDFSLESLLQKKKEEKEKGTFGETKHYNLVPTSKCVVLFVVFKLRWLHLKCTCKYLYDPFTDRALEDETCSFSKEHKIIPCFCLSFSILASKESDIGTRLPGKCQVSLDQHSPVSYLYLQKLSVQCRNSPCNAETLCTVQFSCQRPSPGALLCLPAPKTRLTDQAGVPKAVTAAGRWQRAAQCLRQRFAAGGL